VQAAGNLVGILVEFTACVELGHDDLGRGNAFFFMDAHGNSAAIVLHRNRIISVQRDGHGIRVTCKCFVDAIVHDLVNHVVQTRAIIGVADIHAGAFANCL